MSWNAQLSVLGYSRSAAESIAVWAASITYTCRYYLPTVKYADDLVLMAKEETVLRGMIDKLIETGRCYGMEMNVEKTKVMRISRQPSPVTIMIDQKTTGECGMF